MQTVGVAIIVKDEQQTIGPCLESLDQFVDQVVVVAQKDTSEITRQAIKAASPKAEIYEFEWCDDFAAKRNFSFSKIRTDWVLWVDADDYVLHGEKLKELANNISEQVVCIWFQYHYALDEFGHPTTIYERERLMRMNAGWVWRGRVHETAAPLVLGGQYVRSDDVYILHRHLAGAPRGERNFRLLYQMQKEDPSDKRIWLYLGHQHFAGQEWAKAAEWYLRFGQDQESVPLERWQALCYCSRALRELNDRQAIDVALMAIDLFPDYRDGYLELAHAYYKNEMYDKAIHFANMAVEKTLIKDPPALIFVNPMDYGFNRLILLAECYLRKGEMERALEYYKQAQPERPTPEIAQAIGQLEEAFRRKRIDEAIKLLAVEHHRNREYAKLQQLIATTPYWYRDLPEYGQLVAGAGRYIAEVKDTPNTVAVKDSVTVDLGQSLRPAELLERLDKLYNKVTLVAPLPGNGSKHIVSYSQRDMEELIASADGRHLLNLQRDEHRIVCEYDKKIPQGLHVKMYCGPGYEQWNPKKIIEAGEGGSETSAAWISKELAARDCQPIIYAMDNQVWDGVLYRHFETFNGMYPPVDLMISSRVPDIFNYSMAAEQKYLWVHDIHCGDRLTPEVASELDAIIALSWWHVGHLKRTYPFLKDCEVIDLDHEEQTVRDDEYTPAVFYADDKCFRLPKTVVLGDAILTERYNSYKEIKKKPHQFIWLSSPDRGLEQLLNLWPLIRKEWKDAELKIFYGWNYFDSTLFIPAQRELKERLKILIKQEGVSWMGRVGQNELAVREMESSFLIYPPPHDFRETYGIAFLECQAAGALCFYRPTGALPETVGRRGIPLPMNMSQEAIVQAIIKVGEEKGFARDLRAAARKHAMQRTWGRQAERLLDLYRMLGGAKQWRELTSSKA